MLTLMQLYDLGKTQKIDIFEGIQLPINSPLDRETLINSIITKCGLNIPMYADPYVMTSAVTLWSAQNQYTFDHVSKIYTADYSPIENYDRYEDMHTDRDHELTDNTANTGSKTENVTSNRTTTHSGTDSTTDEAKVSAYDSNTYQPETKSTTDLVHGESISDGGSSTKTTTNNLNTNKGVNENETTIQSNHIRGNIGVVTATATQVEEYNFIGKYNPYEFLAGLFENSLTLFVY